MKQPMVQSYWQEKVSKYKVKIIHVLSLNKKPKFNDVCVLFKNSNFCSRMLKMYSKLLDQPRNRCELFPDNP